MEKWQVAWLTKHLVELHRNTRCTVRLLTALQSKGILDWDEVTELDDEDRTATKVKMFYDILMTKNCYDILTGELGNCKQDGAQKILRDGKVEHERQMKEESATCQEQPPREKRFMQGPEGLKDFLASQEKKVFLISTSDIEVTLTKIFETAGRHVCIPENEDHLRELMMEFSLGCLDLFVFRCEKFPDSEFVGEVISWSPNGAKAVLLAKDDGVSSLESKRELTTSKDILRWTDLKHKFQKELLEKQVQAQVGWETRKVREIFEEAGAKPKLQDEKLLLNLVNDKTPAVFRAQPDAFSYYVQRKIRSRFVLNKNVIFRQEKSDIFLFTGIGAGELSSYLSRCNHSSDNSWSQVNQLSVNYILLEHMDHFDKICENAKGVGVHWIHHENGKFLWAKSGNGSIKRIQEATEGMTDENLLSSETEFVALLVKIEEKYGNFPVLIADTPGMGKSSLLQSLARKMLEKAGTKIILFVAFSDLVNLLKPNTRNSLEVSTETFENALLQLTTECGPELGKCILKNYLRSSSTNRNENKMELMLDGYDEINPDDLPLAKKLLTLIRNTYHSTRIWLATRPHLMHQLENELHVIGFTILPFDECDQQHFLVEFWESEKNIKQEGSKNVHPNIRPDLVKFAWYCLQNMKQIWVKNPANEDICGVPLQCLLIAKVYLEDCLSFTNRDKLTTNSEPRLSLKVSSIKDLYEALIQKKLEIYTERYAKELRPEMTAKLLNAHYFLALQLLFPKYAPLFETALTFESVAMKDILNLGIVEATSVNLKSIPPSFGHRTIPEFLVTRFVAEQLFEDEDCIVKKKKQRMTNEMNETINQNIQFISSYDVGNLLFDGMLPTLEFYRDIRPVVFYCERFENEALAFFLDSLLQERPIRKYPRLEQVVAGRYRPVKACVHGDHLHLFQALRNGFEEVDTDFLLNAVAHSSKLFLEYICNEYNVKLVGWDIFPQSPLAFTTTFLHVAVRHREFCIVEFLLNCQGFGRLVQDYHPSIRDVLRAVIDDSVKDPQWLVNDKILVLHKLVELNRELLDARAEIINQSRYDPREAVHAELTLKLLELGDNPLVRGVAASTLLHSCSKFKADDFHRVVTRLSEAEGKELVNAKDNSKGESVLHKIARNMLQPKKETLEHLLKLGANLAIVNAKGHTCLHVAAENGNMKMTQLLLELGVHANINMQDRAGRTPLDYLLLFGHETTSHIYETVELLLSYGAILSTDIGTTLHQLVRRGNARLLTVPFLLRQISGADVNARNDELNTPLHTCMRNFHRDIFGMAKMLLEHGADLEAKNKNGETPLQILARRSNYWHVDGDGLRTLALFLSKGALVGSVETAQAVFLETIEHADLMLYDDFEELANSLLDQGAQLRNKKGGSNALLHECTKRKWLNGVKYLLAKGVSVNGFSDGETALHVNLGSFGSIEITQHLLEKGANVHALDKHGLTPLQRWLGNSRRDLETFLFFITKLQQESTPLKSADASRILFEVATHKGSLGEVELLQIAQSKLLAVADFRELDRNGHSLLHFAAQSGYSSLVRFFLQKGSDVNVRVFNGQTPLHYALSCRKKPEQVVATLKELLSTETDAKAADSHGNTILDLSLKYQPPLVLKYVLETGQFDEIIRSEEFLWRKVFSIRETGNLRELFSRLAHLLGASLQHVGRNSIDPEKLSLLHAAVKKGNCDLVALLLDAKLFVLAPLSENELLRFSNLLHLCVRNTHVLPRRKIVKRMNITRMLVHHNKELLNSKDAEGRTPLLLKNVHVFLRRALVELGADTNSVDPIVPPTIRPPGRQRSDDSEYSFSDDSEYSFSDDSEYSFSDDSD